MRIALDFDGVIHRYNQGFTTASDVSGGVVDGALDFVKLALEAGHKVCIFSGRSCGKMPGDPWIEELPVDDGGKAAIEEFLATHGFPALTVHCRKPHAELFVDDLGWRFEGTFPALDELEDIALPWYKRNAMQGLATGNRRGKSKKRKQDILTPQIVTDFVRDLWGAGIEMDPCATTDSRSTVNAMSLCTGPETGGCDGLCVDWPDRTFVNPPYATLKPWLLRAIEANEIGNRVVVLCPVRSGRAWWREARDSLEVSGTYVELNPLAFVGYESAFPQPLCLMIWGDTSEDVRRLLTTSKYKSLGVAR